MTYILSSSENTCAPRGDSDLSSSQERGMECVSTDLLEIFTCELCGKSDNVSLVWCCDECGKTFCETCAERAMGIFEAQYMFESAPEVLCPVCWHKANPEKPYKKITVRRK